MSARDRGDRDQRRGGVALVVILATSLALKLVLLVPAHQTYPKWDAEDYFRTAHDIHANGTFNARRPPLYPYFIAACIEVASWMGEGALTLDPGAKVPPAPPLQGFQGKSASRYASAVPLTHPVPPLSDLDIVRLGQVLLSTFTVWLTFLLGRELFDRRAGLWAAGILAFLPDLVGFSHLIWSETLLIALNAGWALLLVRGMRSARIGLLAASGAALALAALTRQVVASLVLPIVVWMFFQQAYPWRRTARLAAALVIAFVVVVAPWTIRNWQVHGVFAPIAPRSGLALLYGVGGVPSQLKRAGIHPYLPHIEIDRRAGVRAREMISEHPAAYLRRAVKINLTNLWAPGSRVAHYVIGKHPGLRGYGPAPVWLQQGSVYLLVASYLALLLLAIIGAGLAPAWRETLLPVGIVLHASFLHALLGANHRHRIYLLAFATLYAGYLLSRNPGELRALVTPTRLVFVAATLIAFAVIISPRVL